MIYDFKCQACGAKTQAVFLMTEYDHKVTEDGRLKRKKCQKCQSLSLYRHIILAPNTLGGPGGYVSMERYQQQNPENTQRLEKELTKKMADSHRKRVLDHIDKQISGGKRDDRHKNYGKGQSEGKLQSHD